MTLLLLADDDAMVRAGLRAVLDSEPDLEVIGEHGRVLGTRRFVDVELTGACPRDHRSRR